MKMIIASIAICVATASLAKAEENKQRPRAPADPSLQDEQLMDEAFLWAAKRSDLFMFEAEQFGMVWSVMEVCYLDEPVPYEFLAINSLMVGFNTDITIPNHAKAYELTNTMIEQFGCEKTIRFVADELGIQ